MGKTNMKKKRILGRKWERKHNKKRKIIRKQMEMRQKRKEREKH